MQLLGCFVILAALSCFTTALPAQSVENDEEFSNYLKRVIELFRQTMTKGIPPLKVPVTEPLSIPTFNINENKNSLKLVGSVSDVKVYNLSKFKINKLEANLVKLYVSLDITIPEFKVDGNYKLDGRISFLPLRGNGTFSLEGKNINTRATLKLDKKDGYIETTDFKIQIDVGKENFKFDIKNLYNNPEFSKIMSEVFSDIGVGLYNNFKGDATNKLKKIVMESLNKALQQQTLKDILSGGIFPDPFDSKNAN